MLNLTANRVAADTTSRCTRHGSAPPNVPNLNVAAGQTIPNLATTKIGTNGQIDPRHRRRNRRPDRRCRRLLRHFPGDRYTPPTPPASSTSAPTAGGWARRSTAAAPENPARPGGATPVPATADAVILNVTATGRHRQRFPHRLRPPAPPHRRLEPQRTPPGQTTSNLVTVKIGTNGQIALATPTGALDVIADVAGYYDPTTGDLYHPLFTYPHPRLPHPHGHLARTPRPPPPTAPSRSPTTAASPPPPPP